MAPIGDASLSQMNSDMIQQVLSFFSGLANTGATPAMPSYQFPDVQLTTVLTPRMGEVLGIWDFPCLVLGPIMTGTKHGMLTKILKMKPPALVVFETKDAFKFIIDCHERLYKMGIVVQYGVDFVTIQLQGDAK